MTDKRRKIGGILAIAGGCFSFLPLMVTLVAPMIEYNLWDTLYILPLIMTISLVIVIIVGGILLISDKKAGGIIALIAGFILLVGVFPGLQDVWYNGHHGIVHLTVTFFIDPILAIVGGILGISVSSEY